MNRNKQSRARAKAQKAFSVYSNKHKSERIFLSAKVFETVDYSYRYQISIKNLNAMFNREARKHGRPYVDAEPIFWTE